MNISELKEWVIVNKIEEGTIIGFWKNIKEYEKDEPQEFVDVFKNFNKEKLSVEIESISLKLGNWPICDYNHIVAIIPIRYEERNIGRYSLLFNLNGEIHDDYFVIF